MFSIEKNAYVNINNEIVNSADPLEVSSLDACGCTGNSFC